ncbi:class I SAM-dependent methyltransferase [Candidatus Pacearchaeota archaeon]|nr:class I SAM-dependent methyltransferase [Candidatus Pacearchaeota archaeon]
MNFLKAFIEDCKYYDLEEIEVKSILKYLKKDQTILDIGAGIGRLSFPISKYAKEVIALDNNEELITYFKKHKRKNIKFIYMNIKDYIKKYNNFNLYIFAWPVINIKLINLIEKYLPKETILIIIIPDNNSDYETIINKLTKKSFKKDKEKKNKFLELLTKKFTLIKKRDINTKYTYPNEKTAFRVLKNAMKLWFNLKFNKTIDNKLKEVIKEHEKNKKIIFGEKIYFYVLKKK